MNERTGALCAFLNQAHSPYHVTAALTAKLENGGYTRLNEADAWELIPGGKYYICRGGSALVAFRVPDTMPKGFMLSSSHCDHPTFKIKENGEIVGNYTKISTEKYGGMIIYSWLDRPLSIAGRVMVETENGVQARLVDLDRDVALIPSVAIHMNRNVNEGYNFNLAVDTLPLIGGKDAQGTLQTMLEEAAGGKILGSDLNLYLRQEARVWGVQDEFLSAAALDDLYSVWGCTEGFLNAQNSKNIPVLCVFDSEEVGSNSPQGADGDLLSNALERISAALKLDHKRMLAGSFMVSADNVHANHPNHPELSDAANAPVLNGGVCVKFNASQRYTTDGLSASIFRKICEKAGIPTQTYYNRADIKGGATLAYVSLSHVSVPSADIGIAQLAMHSCYETAGVADASYLADAMTAYYSTSLAVTGDSYVLK
jgi:aspartyl aminopeptidase